MSRSPFRPAGLAAGSAAVLLAAALTGVAACTAAHETQPGRDPGAAGSAAGGAPAPVAAARGPAARDTTVAPDSILDPAPPLPTPPAVLRGLYVNRWAALGQKMWQLIDVAKRTEVNALVIDVKDDRGYVLYHSRVPLARQIGADTVMPMRADRLRAVLDSMRVAGIFPIARIVVVKDPLLAEHRLDWAIKRKDAPTEPWLDRNGKPWLDPHYEGVWKYAADLGTEAVSLGFGAVQFDYVRFPDEDRIITEAVFPLSQGRTRAQVIRDQLAYVRGLLAPTGVPMTIDVFGLTASDTTDMGIGQKWEMFVDRADVVLPMAYPSHYAPGSFGLDNPNAHPYEVIEHTLRDAKRRSAGIPNAAKVIPWYQDFTLGPPRYGVAEVRAQIQAGYDNGVRSWILWNPGSRYTVDALRPPGADGEGGGEAVTATRRDSTRAAPASVAPTGASSPR